MEWNGRIFVDEEKITPEQYKMFFDRCEYGISFNVANSILKNQKTIKYYNEVVPADELSYEARELIKEQALNGETSGEIEIEGQTLRWNWNYEISDEDEDGNTFDLTWSNVEDFEREKILTDMLDNECVSGMW